MINEQFLNDAANTLSAVVGLANGLPEGENPAMFIRTGSKDAYVFAFTDHWHRSEDIYPSTGFPDGWLCRKADGFMLVHDMAVAGKALTAILGEQGRTWEDIGMKQSSIYEADAVRDILERKNICGMEEWAKSFGDWRMRYQTSVSSMLTISENADGTLTAECLARIESPIFGNMHFKTARVENVQDIDDIRDVVRQSMSEITPWITAPKTDALILAREGVKEEFVTPDHDWEELEHGYPEPDEARMEVAKRKIEWSEPEFDAGFGLAFA